MIYFSKNLKFLRRERGKNQSDIAEMIGVKANSISNYESGVSEPDYTVLSKISKILDINVQDLLYTDIEKKGLNKIAPISAPISAPNPQLLDLKPFPMPSTKQVEVIDNYGNQTPAKLRILNIAVDQHNDEHIIFVPVTAHAGYLRSITDPEWVESLPTFTITGMLPSGTYRAFEVRGDSMENTFMLGDRAIARYVDNRDKVFDNHNYIIVTAEGIVLKRIRQEKGRLRCFSDNDSYGAYTIKNEDILELWHVEGLIRFSIRSKQPNHMAIIENMEHELKSLRKRLDGK